MQRLDGSFSAPARSSSGCARRPSPLSAFASCSITTHRAPANFLYLLDATPSPLEQAHDLGLGERVEMKVEADNGGRGVGFHVDLVGLHRKHSEQIAVRMVALGRGPPTQPGPARLGACRP